MGDFNEDLLSTKKHELHNFLTERGFIQHVNMPTTDYGTLLDHIYTKNIFNVETDVQDCYYSDHDKTYCFVNMS